MDWYCIINTYNREKELTSLYKELFHEWYYWRGFNIRLDVFMDGCNYNNLVEYYNRSEKDGYEFDARFISIEHHGKERYYKLITRNFTECPHTEYYLKLDDDVKLEPDFFDRALEAWNSINDPNLLTLNLHKDFRVSMWGSDPEPYNDLVNKTGWTDGNFMFSKKFLEVFNTMRLQPPPPHVKSSGVFRQISKHMRNIGGMYQVRNSLIYHGNHQSMMNPELKVDWLQ